jgi:hypothetical protein
MMPAFMLMFSAATLIQFFMSYCRSILATYAKVELSAETREIADIAAERIHGGEFARLLGLVHLAPDPGDDRMELRVVRLYYSLVRFVGTAMAPFTSAVRDWSDREGSRCAYFAAVALDRRIASLNH